MRGRVEIFTVVLGGGARGGRGAATLRRVVRAFRPRAARRWTPRNWETPLLSTLGASGGRGRRYSRPQRGCSRRDFDGKKTDMRSRKTWAIAGNDAAAEAASALESIYGKSSKEVLALRRDLACTSDVSPDAELFDRCPQRNWEYHRGFGERRRSAAS